MCLDGISLKRSWGGQVRHVSVLVAIGVAADGYREVLGIAEGAKEDKAGWLAFLRHLKTRGLRGVKLFVSDACLGLVESLGELYPESLWQRCVAHWYRNVFSITPKGKVQEVSAMLKAIQRPGRPPRGVEEGRGCGDKLDAMKLPKAAQFAQFAKIISALLDRIYDRIAIDLRWRWRLMARMALVRESVEQTLSYTSYPREHWLRIRTNNPLERIMREIRRRTRVVGSFPDGQSALMLAAARLRHVAGTRWGIRRYLDMKRLDEQEQERQQEEPMCVAV